MGKRSLFGAITTTVPDNFRDARYTRRVPFNQEVFVDSNRDQGLVFEVRELEEGVEDGDSAEHFLKELIKKLYPDAKPDIEQGIPNCGLKKHIDDSVITTAVKKVDITSKRRQGKEVQNLVKVYLANLRLKDPKYKTDVIISAYEPVNSINSQSDHTSGGMAQTLKDAVSDFEVTDWSFFTDE